MKQTIQSVLKEYYIGPTYSKNPLRTYPLSTQGTWMFSGQNDTFKLTGTLEECILKVTSDFNTYRDIIYWRSMDIELVHLEWIDTKEKLKITMLRTELEATRRIIAKAETRERKLEAYLKKREPIKETK